MLLDSAPEAIFQKWRSYVAMLLDSAPEAIFEKWCNYVAMLLDSRKPSLKSDVAT
jgi:predicted phosphoadenosine phosphosulfate sulfurtransferase